MVRFGGLSLDQIASLLLPYLPVQAIANSGRTGPQLCECVSVYLELLLKWNARTNLTAIRSPEEIVMRHFGESFFAAAQLSSVTESVLDLGSGAGFPGIPIQLICPGVRVMLAESQHKKVAFLREVIRTLGLQTEMWPRRTEEFQDGTRFDVVALRAVDGMESAMLLAANLAATQVVLLGTRTTEDESRTRIPSFTEERTIPVPNSERRVVRLFRRWQETFHVEQSG